MSGAIEPQSSSSTMGERKGDANIFALLFLPVQLPVDRFRHPVDDSHLFDHTSFVGSPAIWPPEILRSRCR